MNDMWTFPGKKKNKKLPKIRKKKHVLFNKIIETPPDIESMANSPRIKVLTGRKASPVKVTKSVSKSFSKSVSGSLTDLLTDFGRSLTDLLTDLLSELLTELLTE